MSTTQIQQPTEVDEAAHAWRVALATLGPDRSPAGRATHRRTEGALTGCQATVRALAEGCA